MEGLILPLLVFTGICLALAIKFAALAGIQRWWGTLRIQKLLQLELPGSHYTILHNVSIPSPKGTLTIDHLVVSAYGIFVIKHVSGAGRIAGKPGDGRWIRTIHRSQQAFRNPLFDCVAEVNALRALLGLDAKLFQFVLVFSGNVSFSNPMPVNVTRLDGLPLFIEGRDQLVIDFDDMRTLAGRVRAAQPGTDIPRSPARPATS